VRFVRFVVKHFSSAAAAMLEEGTTNLTNLTKRNALGSGRGGWRLG
jgi:hypothetical protein